MNIFKKCRVRTALLNVMTVNRNCLCQLRGCRFGPPQTDAGGGARAALEQGDHDLVPLAFALFR